MKISVKNIDAYAIGASFLGSGGGGDVSKLLPMAKRELEKYGDIEIISDIDKNAKIAAIEFVGAPAPEGASKANWDALLVYPVLEMRMKEIERIDAIMPVEIGGSNALTPVCVAGRAGLPIYDGDLLGRALPDIFLTSTNIFDRHPDVVYISNPITGDSKKILCDSFEELEKKAREFAIGNESYSAVQIPLVLSGKEADKMGIRGSVTKALEIGDCLMNKSLPEGSFEMFDAIVSQYDPRIENGFLRGVISFDNGFFIDVRNEYMVLRDSEGVVKRAPDIITLIDTSTYLPIPSDRIKCGDIVKCIVMPGPDMWSYGKGLELINKSLEMI